MTVEEQNNMSSFITNTTRDSSLTENIGQQARLESGKNFESVFGKLLLKIHKHIAVASSKGLWSVKIELPRSAWTLDRENQRRIIQKLKDNELAPHFKLLPEKILLVIFWSENDMKLTAQELEALQDFEPTPFAAKQRICKQRRFGLDQQSNQSTAAQSNVLTLKDGLHEPNFALVPLEPTEVVHQTLGTSSDEHEGAIVPRDSRASLKEARLAEREQKKLARQQQMQENKRARREEKLRQKQMLKNKERVEEREKKKEEKIKRKALKEQRLLNRAKKEKTVERLKKFKVDKKKEIKESSSSSERTWSESDLSQSSGSESD